MWTSEGIEVSVEDSDVWDTVVARFRTVCNAVTDQVATTEGLSQARSAPNPTLDAATNNGLTDLAALRWEES